MDNAAREGLTDVLFIESVLSLCGYVALRDQVGTAATYT